MVTDNLLAVTANFLDPPRLFCLLVKHNGVYPGLDPGRPIRSDFAEAKIALSFLFPPMAEAVNSQSSPQWI